MTRREPTPNPPVLLWDEQGRICCPRHAPYPGSDTWRNDRWRRMSDAQLAAWAATNGAAECEVCGPRALARRAEARR